RPRPTLFPYTTLFRSVRRSRRPSFAGSRDRAAIYLTAIAAALILVVATLVAMLVFIPAMVVFEPAATASPVTGNKPPAVVIRLRSEEHTSELQSRSDL